MFCVLCWSLFSSICRGCHFFETGVVEDCQALHPLLCCISLHPPHPLRLLKLSPLQVLYIWGSSTLQSTHSHRSSSVCCLHLHSLSAMSSRRRGAPADLAAVRKSRAGFTGAVTKALDKLHHMKSDQPEDIQALNTKEVDRLLVSLTRTETGFLQNLEDAQAFIPDGEEEEAFNTDEDLAMEAFQESVSSARDRADQLLALKSVLTGLADFKTDSTSIQDFLVANPESNQTDSFKELKTLYQTLKEEWKRANLSPTHAIKAELDACRTTITTLEASVSAIRDKSDSISSITSSTLDRSSSPCCGSKSDLPVIDVPKFYGNIMTWSTFWASFESTIGSRKDLDDTKRLHYLRMAVKDEDARKLLYSPVETPAFYTEVVGELKRRYDRTREVHRALTKTVLDLQTPKQTRTDLRRLTDQVKRTICSFKATEFYTAEALRCSTVYLLLPQKLQTLWDQHTKREKGVPSVDKLLDFLQDHAEALPSCPTNTQKEENPTKRPYKKPSQPSKGNNSRNHVNAVTAPSSNSYKWECWLCKPDKHPLHICPKWNSFSVAQRLEHVKTKNLCTNCLAGGHTLSNCKSTYKCRDCGQKHHTSIHQDSAATTPVNSACSTSHQVPDALMTTAQVLLMGPRGQELKARALIDFGAGLSLISHKVAQTLGLPLSPSKLQLSGVQGATGKPAKFLTTVTISTLLNRERRIQCTPAVVQVVTADLPPEKVEPVHGLDHIAGLQLADENYNIPARIDILLGADLAPQIMTRRMLRTGKDYEPMAQATEFGWVLSGPATRSHTSTNVYPANHTHIQPEPEPPLRDVVLGFWQAEEAPGDEEPTPSQQEAEAELHYVSHTTYSPSDCRYQVTLPRKPGLFPLGESRSQAVSRYLSNERSILKRQVWEPFQHVIRQYLELGHAERVPLSEISTASYYLPMHAVFKDSSSTTKLRVMFDGSATTASGTSLNQALLVGPTIQPTLSNTLLKFRCYPIALNSDISKMYREVMLYPPDKDLHRFVWRDSPSDPILDHRMCRVTFGVSASPFLAVRTLQQTARDHGGDYPDVTHHLINSFYVDDFLGGATSTQEAIRLFHNMREVLQKGGFNLTKWRSSSREVLQEIPPYLQEVTPIKDSTSSQTPTISKALGLVWDSDKDVMSPCITVAPTFTSTKRGIFRDVSKTYDVLGWIAPTVLVMKVLFQELWKTGQEWDNEVPPDLAAQHIHWRNELPLLKQKTLPRCYRLPHLTPVSTQLHAFSDASLKAYGAVVYCRTTYREHPPVVVLVTAKTKVAKIDPPTVPRLELCGAVLLVKLLTSTAKILDIPMDQWHAWTDSSIVLAWLDGQPRQFKQYVANRVSFILQDTTPHTWKHVPTGENPADCSSRGMLPSELLNHSLWWDGPLWLQQDPYLEPHQPPRRTLLPMELRPTNIVIPYYSLASRIQERAAGYHTILAETAWCLRFIQRIRHGRPNPDTRTRHLTGVEITQARDWLLRENQTVNFPKEKKALERGLVIPPTSRLRALNPLLDDTHLIRVGGRLANSSLSYSQQHPVIADSTDALIQKWFRHIHLSLCHCGPSLLLSYAGNHLHILGAHKLSRKVCSQCTSCRKVAPRWSTQLMGDLPAQRVTPVRAFLHTGIGVSGICKVVRPGSGCGHLVMCASSC